jgi:hypothetical protein
MWSICGMEARMTREQARAAEDVEKEAVVL